MTLLLDTGILGKLCHPKPVQNRPVAEWLANLLERDDESLRVFIPEIADDELRRKLLQLIAHGQAAPSSIHSLEALTSLLDYLPLSTPMLRRAAEFWAQSRNQGLPTAHPEALDGDVILAAQAESVGGIVVTENLKHLSRFVTAKTWTEVPV